MISFFKKLFNPYSPIEELAKKNVELIEIAEDNLARLEECLKDIRKEIEEIRELRKEWPTKPTQ